MTVFIPKNHCIPIKKSWDFTTYSDNNSMIYFQIFEDEKAMTKNSNLIGKFTLGRIPLALRGIPRLEVIFRVDSDGILDIASCGGFYGKYRNITVFSDKGRLNKSDLERMIDEAEGYKILDDYA